MKRRHFIQLLAMGTASSLAAEPLKALTTRKPLEIGVFPRRNAKATYRMFNGLTAYLGSRLSLPARLSTARDFESFWENVRERRYDLVHFNHYHYAIANRLYGYQAIAMNEENHSNQLAGGILTRRDAGITGVDNLKGRKIVFGGGPRAMLSYIIPRWLLDNAGLQQTDYITEYARNPPNAIFSVYHRQADAAGAGNAALQMKAVTQVIDTNELDYLLLSKPIVHLPWAVADTVDPSLAETIQSVLLSLNNDVFGQHLLKKAGMTGILAASDDDYAGARDIIQSVYGGDLGVAALK